MKKVIFFILMLVIVILFINCVWYNFYTNRNYAVKINNDCISLDEFSVYKEYSAIINDDADINIKDEAVKNAVSVYAAVRFANKKNLPYEYEDKQREQYLCGLMKEKISISPDIIESTCKKIAIYEKVYRYTTDNFVLSENDFKDFFAQYKEENKKNLNKISISFIFLSSKKGDLSLAEDIYGKSLDGWNFSKLADKYSESSVMNIDDISKSNFDEEVTDVIYGMDKGDIELIETDKGFYIVRADKVERVPDKNIEKDVEKIITEKRKEEIYSAQNEKWLENDVIEKNEDL